jgi:ribonuclease D
MPTSADYQWLDSEAALRDWLAGLEPHTPLYLDTEFMRERVFWAQLALVQINTGRELVLIDPLQVSIDRLTELVEGRHLVMHGCSEDLEVLWQTTGRLPASIGDTQIGAALTGSALQSGYQRLVEDWLAVELPKGATRTDWLQRPLSTEQLRYAVQDVQYLTPLAERLHERLREQGRLSWWEEECARMLREATRVPEAADLWRQVKGAGKLPPDQRAVLQSLAAWRDEQARARNLPRGFVIRDQDLLQLADRQPDSAGAVGTAVAVAGPGPASRPDSSRRRSPAGAHPGGGFRCPAPGAGGAAGPGAARPDQTPARGGGDSGPRAGPRTRGAHAPSLAGIPGARSGNHPRAAERLAARADH